jgi:hypothetical protein
MDKSEVNVGSAVAAGMAAGTAYLATMWADNKLSSHHFNDLKLVGQIFTTKSPLWVIQGVVTHYGFSAVVALAYAAWGYRRLPGPPWLKGLLFLQIENTTLYPLAAIMDRFHAGVRSGQLPPVLKWKSYWGQVLRHVAFGVVLGALYKAR